MMEIMAYATGGREFEVMDNLAEMGVTYWHGKRIEFERRGKSRIAEPFEYPALPNYLHITAPFHMVSDIMDIRHLSRTIKFLHPADVRGWFMFKMSAEARLADAKRIIAQRERLVAEAAKARADGRSAEHAKAVASAARQEVISAMSQYKAGDTIEISGGAFAGMLATFGRMVVKPGTAHPMVEAKVELFGGETTATLDLLTVRKAG